MKLKLSGFSYGLLIVVLLSLLPLAAFFHTGLPITHDGMDHVARVANFYESLTDGNIIPRWAENLNWGYGHPILMFLYPFSSYLASFFHVIHFSYVDSVKLVFVTSYIASGIAMYLWARKQFNAFGGIAASVLYLFAPYRFVDIYVRGAIGEHVALVFPPLVLFFLLSYYKSKSKVTYNMLGISVSFALLLLSHNAISIMFIPFFVIYSIYLGYVEKDYKKIFISFVGFFWGLMLSAFFLFPAFFEGKYTLRDIVTGNEYSTRFVNPLSLLYGKWSYGISGQFSVQIGFANLLFIILSFVVFLKQKRLRLFLIMMYSFLLISIFLTLPQSDFLYSLITTLKKFQFPWRFLNLTIFFSAVLGGSFFVLFKKRTMQFLFLVVLILLSVCLTFPYWWANGYFYKNDSFYNSVYHGTTDTGESAPIWSVRFMEHQPKEHIEIISGEANVRELERTSTQHRYSISVISNDARFKENTLYFPNWMVFANGKKINIQFQDPQARGLITFTLTHGEYNVAIVFKDTKLRILSNIISILGLIAVPIMLGITFAKRTKFNHGKK